ncbi:MAG TPA: LysM peptidoglycan-binding domain-containing protein [Acidimicrobiales bacterium]|nr:LysM peptidoglycan-binding domain-containing protein [Acidimicrobiales bacterium]
MAAIAMRVGVEGLGLPESLAPKPFDWQDLDWSCETSAPRPFTGRYQPRGRGLRRYLPGVATLAMVAGVAYGASALATTRAPVAAAALAGQRTAPATALLPGATLRGGATYVARAGDTLWGIALRVDPNGDPRPIVAALSNELGGATLQPGDLLTLP